MQGSFLNESPLSLKQRIGNRGVVIIRHVVARRAQKEHGHLLRVVSPAEGHIPVDFGIEVVDIECRRPRVNR